MELFRRGYLRLMHLMIASLKQFPVLARKKNGAFWHESLASRALAGAVQAIRRVPAGICRRRSASCAMVAGAASR